LETDVNEPALSNMKKILVVVGILKDTEEKSGAFPGSGSVPKCHGSGTLLWTIKKLVQQDPNYSRHQKQAYRGPLISFL
jgi:hypothetical protein